MPECDSFVAIRSTIKSGEYKGLKVCPGCKMRAEPVTKQRKPLKPFNAKSKDKRKAERVGLPDFFEKAIIDLKKKPICENCGRAININYEPIMNIAHILPKSRYKSVMAHPENKLFLCAYKDNMDGSSCHYVFDNEIDNIKNMNCFEEAKRKFEIFKTDVVERGKIFTIFDDN